MKLQTSALSARRTAASIAGVGALAIVAGGAGVSAQSGWASPRARDAGRARMVRDRHSTNPRPIEGRRVVVASAPESEWQVTNLGPFLDAPDCSRCA